MTKTLTPSEMGRKGGKNSVKSRFKGKSKKEISEMMSRIRLSKSEEKTLDRMTQESVDALNASMKRP